MKMKMFDKEFISKNFLSPEENNYLELVNKIESFLSQMSKKHSKYSPIRKRDADFSTKVISGKEEIPYSPSADKKIQAHLSNIFQGSIRWHSPFALLNIAPSPLLDAVAAATVTALYNPNSLWDVTSGNVILHEKKIIKALCELVGWPYENAEGLATFGGKATLMYAIKIGIHKLNLNIISDGVKDDYYVIASDRAHYSLEDVCNFMGIGSKKLIRIETNSNGQIIQKKLKYTVEKLLREDKKIACLILNCGVTIDMCVDPILDIKTLLINIFRKHKSDKIPHIHADSVAGWVWLFFKNFNKNNFKHIDNCIVNKLRSMYQLIEQIKYSDSFSADFHKTGLSPYSSTFFVAKNYSDITRLTKTSGYELKKSNKLGDLHVHYFTFENSRSSIGIVSAWIAL